jgi:hypothetical protein
MIHIERIRMQLPQGFEHRASSIARLVGESMASIHPTENRSLDNLSIGPVRVSRNATDQEIAGTVAERIAVTLGVGK